MPPIGGRSSPSFAKRSADMSARFWLGAAAAVALAAGAGALPAAPRVDWTGNVVATPEGGFRFGNPAARIKVVEYGSLSCDHCANFALRDLPKLVQNHVKAGKVSFEFRNYVRDPYDLTAALLSRCTVPGRFFPATDSYFASQQQWLARAAALTEAQIGQINAVPKEQRFATIASLVGLDAVAVKTGLTPAKAKACLTDPKGVERLVEMRRVADTEYQVPGTPSFVINGVRAEGVHSWTALEPLLGQPAG